MDYKPPFTISDITVTFVAEIMEKITKIALSEVQGINPRLRRDNRIKTIHASLAIENNSLSLEQVTAIINGKRILGPGQDIKEVQNAYEAYEMLLELDPYNHIKLFQDLYDIMEICNNWVYLRDVILGVVEWNKLESTDYEFIYENLKDFKLNE